MRSDLIAEIHIDNLIHNCRALRACCRAGVKLCAPLKADAYGHGLRAVVPALREADIDLAAVATLEEAGELRELDWRAPILVMGNVLAVADAGERRERIAAILERDLTISIGDEDAVRHLVRAEPGRRIDVHLKFDSGMGRMGVMPDRLDGLVQSVRRASCLRVVGFYSHLAAADSEDTDHSLRQLANFERASRIIGEAFPGRLIRHIANSAATIALPRAHLDMVRPGLALFGYLPAERMAGRIELRPILRLRSHFTAIKELPVGATVGYGCEFTAKRPTRLGVVPIGYADGFLRGLSDGAVVGTPEGDAPIIGRISMDQLSVDLTDLPPLSPGTEVTLIDERPDRPNSVAAIARRLGTIPYEVTSTLGPRIQRVAVGAGCTSKPSLAAVEASPN